MSDTEEDLWDAQRLAQYLGMSPKTVIAKASRAPEELPPRAPMRLQRWVPSVCRAWASGETKKRGGRPRLPA